MSSSKIHKVEFKHHRQFGDEHFDLNGRSVFLLGPNGAKKSSFINAVFSVLTREKHNMVPVKEGHTSAETKIEIKTDNGSTYIVESKYTPGKPAGTLTFRGVDGEKYGKPVDEMNKIFGDISLDIFDFLSKSPSKQVEIIKQLPGVNLDLSDLDEEHKETYEARKSVNLEIKHLKGNIETKRKTISDADIQTFTEPKDLDSISEGIKKIESFNTRIESIETVYDNLANRLASIDKLTKEGEERVTSIDAEIARLQNEKADILTKREYYNRSKVIWETRQNSISDYLEVTPRRTSSEENERYHKAVNFNRRVEEVKELLDQINKVDELTAEAKNHTENLTNIELEKRDRINNANLPVDGLFFDETGLKMLNEEGIEVPFDEEHIPKSKLILAGAKILIAMNPGLKLCRIKDGSLLDKQTTKELLQLLDDNDYQAFIEVVDETDDGKLHLELIER